MQQKKAFTLLELVFVIVIMGIIGKFGTEFLAQSYKNFIFTNTNHTLQSNSEAAIEIVAAQLQNRIKDSVIARTSPTANPVPIESASGDSYTILEWVGVDSDGFRGSSEDNDTGAYRFPDWSGIIDLDAGDADTLVSPETNTTLVDTLIRSISENNATIDDAALYFIGSNSNAVTDYGWDGNTTTIDAQQGAMHPITTTANEDEFTSSTGTNFSGVDIYEYYKLSWTAYALVYVAGTNNKGTLWLYWNYQPWKGEKFTDSGKYIYKSILMEDVSTFRFTAIGSILKVQICVKSDLIEEYSLCKEKTIF
jgi:prepilin-type N-terminal cleavage/methylation domain-containing protein